jgi:GDPmannose 4,6-dehydratase
MKNNKRALITGIGGQDGSYLAELLLDKGYEVHGLIRRTSNPNTRNIRHLLYDKKIFNKTLFLHDGDLADASSVRRVIGKIKPNEIYNFAAMAGVGPSFDQVEYTMDVTGSGVVRILEAIKDLYTQDEIDKREVKFFQATSSHIFGATKESPQFEGTKLEPISPYACAKALGHHLVNFYREAYNIFACSAIFYAHASPRYSEGFLLSKIIHNIWKIQDGEIEEFEVGNLDVPLDVGYAKEFMEAVYSMMQIGTPDDFVLATGETHTPREILAYAFLLAGLDVDKHVKENSGIKRKSEVGVLVGDIGKARLQLDFRPQVKFKELLKIMFESRNA